MKNLGQMMKQVQEMQEKDLRKRGKVLRKNPWKQCKKGERNKINKGKKKKIGREIREKKGRR